MSTTTAALLAKFRKELIEGGFSDEYDPKHGASEVFQLVSIYARADADNPLVVKDEEPTLTYAVENHYTTALSPAEIAEQVVKAFDERKRQGLL